MKQYSCCNGHQVDASESRETWCGLSVCPECWPNGFMKDPERSKREEFCLTKLADKYLEEWEFIRCQYANEEEAYIKGVYNFSDWLKQNMRCSEHCGNTVRGK